MVKENEPRIRKLSPELQEKAIAELNEDPKRIHDDLEHIKDWLARQPHIKARTDDQWLIAFLRGCKYNLEKTKQKLDAFYMMRTLMPEFFTNRNPFSPELQKIIKQGMFLPMSNTESPASPQILLIRNAEYDLRYDNIADVMKLILMYFDILLMENDNFVVAGDIAVNDVKNVTLAHFAWPPTIIEKILICYQQTYPLRVKEVHYVNSTSIFDLCFNIIKPFINDKLAKRMKKHVKIESFYEDFPQKLLPAEYGGEAGTIQQLTDMWKKKVESYASWFKEDAQFCTNENLRPGKPITVYDVFGVEESYRKLNID